VSRSTAATNVRVRESTLSGEFAMTDRDFKAIAAMLYVDAGIYLPDSKSTLVYSRLVKRLRALNLASFREYCDLVGTAAGRGERREMLSALTTNVTRFFREPHHFDHLRVHVLPRLLEQARRGGRVRLWSAACSTGQEPYSMALSVLELEPKAGALDVRILASDIDPRVVEQGRAGVYSEAALGEVPPVLRERYFTPVGGEARGAMKASDELRRLVVFRTLNLNGAWPMPGKFHAIFCRNVVIYFDEETQQAVWSKFADKLSAAGWLYIGHSERVTGPATTRFVNEGVTAYRLRDEDVP
jgi:chemotaxis protein methyltransferase CheR